MLEQDLSGDLERLLQAHLGKPVTLFNFDGSVTYSVVSEELWNE
jgi:hypothetical protein